MTVPIWLSFVLFSRQKVDFQISSVDDGRNEGDGAQVHEDGARKERGSTHRYTKMVLEKSVDPLNRYTKMVLEKRAWIHSAGTRRWCSKRAWIYSAGTRRRCSVDPPTSFSLLAEMEKILDRMMHACTHRPGRDDSAQVMEGGCGSTRLFFRTKKRHQCSRIASLPFTSTVASGDTHAPPFKHWMVPRWRGKPTLPFPCLGPPSPRAPLRAAPPLWGAAASPARTASAQEM